MSAASTHSADSSAKTSCRSIRALAPSERSAALSASDSGSGAWEESDACREDGGDDEKADDVVSGSVKTTEDGDGADDDDTDAAAADCGIWIPFTCTVNALATCDDAIRSRITRRRSFMRALAAAARCRFNELASRLAETDDGASEKDVGSALNAADAGPVVGDNDGNDGDVDAVEAVDDDWEENAELVRETSEASDPLLLRCENDSSPFGCT